MAYADQSISSRKVISIGLVAALHALLGYAFITGLAFNVIKKVSTDLKTFDVEEAPPPKAAPPPPPPKTVVQPPPVVTPPPIVQVQTVTAPQVISVPVAPPIHVEAPVAPPAPPVSQAVKATPRGSPKDWVTAEDYPSSDMRAGNQGVTAIKLDVGPDGKVTGCTVTSSSGFPSLDSTACQRASRRARFSPAKDASGAPTTSIWNQRVRWEVPKD